MTQKQEQRRTKNGTNGGKARDDLDYDDITSQYDIVREKVRKSGEAFVTTVHEVAEKLRAKKTEPA